MAGAPMSAQDDDARPRGPGPTVLLALHYQNEVLHRDGKIRVGMAENDTGRAAVLRSASRLLAGVRAAGLPVVSVRIAFRPDYTDVVRNCPVFRNVVKLGAMPEGSWGAEFYEGLGPLPGREAEYVVSHNRVNAFYGSTLAAVLESLGAGQLVLAGVATHSVVEHTARHAADMGYEVAVAADACSSGAPELHKHSLRSMALIADVADVETVLARLGGPGA